MEDAQYCWCKYSPYIFPIYFSWMFHALDIAVEFFPSCFDGTPVSLRRPDSGFIQGNQIAFTLDADLEFEFQYLIHFAGRKPPISLIRHRGCLATHLHPPLERHIHEPGTSTTGYYHGVTGISVTITRLFHGWFTGGLPYDVLLVLHIWLAMGIIELLLPARLFYVSRRLYTDNYMDPKVCSNYCW